MKKALIVEDTIDVANGLKSELGKYCEVDIASDLAEVKEFVKCYGGFPYCLVTLDLFLESENGISEEDLANSEYECLGQHVFEYIDEISDCQIIIVSIVNDKDWLGKMLERKNTYYVDKWKLEMVIDLFNDFFFAN